ncbi:MAG: class I SAM-dependent methyltransferase [Dehalococcoidia bacterium]|nr:class I SAM-dependent methyltransferase [Dehalococcoidia bacterium]
MSQNRKSVPASTYGQEWIEFSNSAKEYERFLSEGELRPRQLRSLALADLKPGDLVLDMGCGRGEVSLYCASRGIRVVATDYSEDCLALAAQAQAVSGGSVEGRLLVARADSKALPLCTDTVCRVLLLDVVEHLYPWELELALAEAYRVLKPGGYLVIHTLPNRWALDVGYRWARFFLRRLPRDPRSDWERTVHINEQDIVVLHRVLAKEGFEARVWLEDSILAQARWQRGGRAFPAADLRARAYPLLVNPMLRTLYRIALATPLRLVLANDIYAVAFKGSVPRNRKWGGWLERLLGLASRSGTGEVRR